MMGRNWLYLKYVVRHKWFVLLASWRIGAPLLPAILHDLSKFRPSEWFPYSATFYSQDGTSQYNETSSFNRVWLMHQHRNPHHWQYWVLRMDCGDTVPIEIPRRYVVEMVADWMGAGRAITGRWECSEWYAKNRDKIILHDNTRRLVDILIDIIERRK